MNKKKGKFSEWGLKWMLSVIAVFFLLLLFTGNSYSQTGDLKRFSITPIPPPSEGVAVFRDHPDKAGIIIESPISNLTFSSNMDGIVDQRSEPGRGRYVLIIEPSTQIIVVDAPGYIQGRFRVGNPSARDVLYYEIEAKESDPDLISVIFNVRPEDALLYVDDQQTETNRTVQLPPGPAELRLEREGYRMIQDAIRVSTENISLNYEMEEIDIVPVRIVSNVPGARVSIDGMDRGEIDSRGGLGLFLFPGNYALSVAASGHLITSKTVEVQETGNNSFAAELQRNIGTLRLTLSPSDAQVTINREDYTGQNEIELVPGRYRLEVTKDGYAPYAESLELAFNETMSRTITIEAYTGSLQFSVVPSDAGVSLRDASGGQVQSWEGLNFLRGIKTGTYTLYVEASGYLSRQYNIEITRDEILEYHVELTEGSPWGRDTKTAVVEVTNPATGRIWMDRNLGASRAATSSTDFQAHGDLYQWGRPADGHQKRNSSTNHTRSRTDQPGHGSFILAPNSPHDWRSPQNDDLWQGVSGVNNPCPAGYRIPTDAEWNAERQNWSSDNAAGAFASPLKLPLAGYRYRSTGSLYGVGSSGRYWSSSVSGSLARRLYFVSSNADTFSTHRPFGLSVRCTKD